MSVRAWNFALRAVARASDEEEGKARVLEVWEAMRREMVRPSEYTLSELARGLCRGVDDVREASATLREAVSLGATMNSFAIDALIVACMKEEREMKHRYGRDERRSRRVADTVLEVWQSGRGYHSEVSLANAMRTLQMCGREKSAMEIFRENEVKIMDVELLKIALQCCAAVDGLQSAERMYRDATTSGGVKAETSHANALLHAAKDEGNVAFATMFFDAMLAGAEPKANERSLNLVLLACAAGKKPDVAMKYFQIGREANIQCDDETMDALLMACANSGRVVDALGVFMDALEQGIKVTGRTISLLLEAYEHVASQPGQLQQALTIADMGAFLNVEPSERMVKALLRLCVAGGDFERGREELRKAVQRGVPVTYTAVSILALPYAERGQVDETLGAIRFGRDLGVSIKPGVFIQTISALKARKDGAGALELYRAARDEFGVTPDKRMVEELFDALGRSKLWEDALRVLSDDVLSSKGALKSFSELTVAHLVRALASAGELEQAEVALGMGRLLTKSENTLAARRLANAKRARKNSKNENK